MKKSYKKLFMFVVAFMFLLQTTAFGIVEEPTDFNLTVEVDPNEAATYNGEAEGAYSIGESYEVSINDFTINEGWLFDHWSDGSPGITTGGIFTDDDIEVVAFFEPSLPATTVILIEGDGYVVASDLFNTINIDIDDTPYVLTYLEKIGDYSYIDLAAYANEGYIFDHWEYETDMDPNEYDPGDNIWYNYMFGDCLAGYTLTATAIFVEAPKLTVQVEAPNTGTVEIDGLYYNNIAQEPSPSLSQHSNRLPQYSPPDPVSTFSASTTDEWVFYYYPNEMNSLNVTCSAIESDVAYYFDHWDIEYWDGNEWQTYGVSSEQMIFGSSIFEQFESSHIRATANFVEAPTLTVKVEAPNTGTVEIDGIIGEYYGPLIAPLVNQSPQYAPPDPTSIFPTSTTDEWVFYYIPTEMNGLNVTCSAIESVANYYFDHWSLEYLTEDGWKSPVGFNNQSDTLSNFAWIFDEMRTDQVKVTAYFEYEAPPTPKPKRYTLTIDSTDGGSVNFEGSFTRDSGTMFDLELFEEEGYEFIEWIGDTDALNSDGDVVLYKDTSLTAVFEEIQEEVIEEEETPEEPEEEEILDEEIPEAPTPETGGIPFAAFGGAGAMLIGIGTILRKRYKR